MNSLPEKEMMIKDNEYNRKKSLQ